ncbi:MAG TPA: type IX secretion system sortase PorU, partial [Chitinophagaceae bacterium]
VYETVSSLDPLGTYTSDDFFGFLDDHENINSGLILNLLDIGIGRIPVKNVDEAKNFVDKIENYHSKSSFGPWRNNMDFIADDEDFNLHLQDAEVLTATAMSTAPVFNYHKIYLDAFRQESSSAGARYPQANAVINNNIYNGTLLWNYSGHGGALRLAEEVVIDQSIVNKWNNENKLPLFVTATCDFAPYDHPLVNSLGENLLVRPKTGAIALMTTSRVVFAYSNRIINNNYLQLGLAQNSNGEYKTLGEAVKATKNFTYQNSGDLINNRKFALLGDPAMTLGFPQLKTVVKTINGQDVALITDTLSAGEFVTIDGEVTDHSGTLVNNFNGTAYLTVYDKPSTLRTLANDPTSQPVDFQTQTSSLFRGKATANAGKFSFRFRLPKDINYQFGNGKLSLYAHDDEKDANGFSTNFIVGGIGTGGISDNEGPVIKAYLNDDRFVNGSITNETPVLILKLSDSSGINTGNAGIDHDIIATLDNDNRKYFILNDFYESELDSYQSGTVRFQLPELAPGQHTLHIKAWDVMNNSSEYVLEFTVHNDGDLVLDHVLNYPNPFTTKTSFWFEHNRPGEDLHTRVEIFTVTGKIIKTLTRTINTDGNRSNELEWDGIDEYGDKIGRGVYLYRLTVQTVDGKKATHIQRLVVIR